VRAQTLIQKAINENKDVKVEQKTRERLNRRNYDNLNELTSDLLIQAQVQVLINQTAKCGVQGAKIAAMMSRKD